MLYTLIGFLIMFGALAGIGITKPRGTSIKMWCYGYLAIAIIFDILVIIALLNQYSWLTETLLGLAAGAATGLAIHVAHHILEENDNQEHNNKTETKTIFGF
ncbi:MAG: hypothetical protein N3E52_03905 [Candidatus Bathyarchaeota archaeon]|nr:hypothetical protein [Candidatus Bathyarchaeota archaeon]